MFVVEVRYGNLLKKRKKCFCFSRSFSFDRETKTMDVNKLYLRNERDRRDRRRSQTRNLVRKLKWTKEFVLKGEKKIEISRERTRKGN